jgi:hypothetical protein
LARKTQPNFLDLEYLDLILNLYIIFAYKMDPILSSLLQKLTNEKDLLRILPHDPSKIKELRVLDVMFKRL